MNAMTQPDLHPDADTLNAFVEHALADAESARIVAHMAGCGRCRDIVYLARAAAEPKMAPAAAVEAEPRPGRFSRMFAKWRVALIPAAALASVGAIMLWVQLHPAPAPMEMAKVVPQSHPLSEAASAGQNQAAQPAVQASKERAAAAAPAVATPNQAERIPGHEGKKAAAPALDTVDMNQQAQASSMAASVDQRRATSPIHLDARSAAMARYAPPPEPISPPAVQAFTPPGTRSLSPTEPMANGAGKGPVTVTAAPSRGIVPAPAATPPNIVALHGELEAPAVGGPAQLAAQSQATPERELQPPDRFEFMWLAKRAKLPSGLNAVSSAALLNRLVVVDSAGSVFLSQDAGQHWEAVRAQWSGKAVTVQAPPQGMYHLLSATASQRADSTAVSARRAKTNGEKDDGNAVPAPPAPAGPRVAPAADSPIVTKAAPPPAEPLFKVFTDRHEVWVSPDGKVWHQQ